MNKTTTYAAATLAVLTALSGVGILVHQGATVTGQDGDVTPRTVVAEPAPCPFPYPMAICAPIPPAPLDVSVPEDAPMTEVAEAYAAAWEGVK